MTFAILWENQTLYDGDYCTGAYRQQTTCSYTSFSGDNRTLTYEANSFLPSNICDPWSQCILLPPIIREFNLLYAEPVIVVLAITHVNYNQFIDVYMENKTLVKYNHFPIWKTCSIPHQRLNFQSLSKSWIWPKAYTYVCLQR